MSTENPSYGGRVIGGFLCPLTMLNYCKKFVLINFNFRTVLNSQNYFKLIQKFPYTQYLVLPIFFFFFFFWPCCMACRILLPRTGIKLMAPTVEVQSLNHLTSGEDLSVELFLSKIFKPALLIQGLMAVVWDDQSQHVACPKLRFPPGRAKRQEGFNTGYWEPCTRGRLQAEHVRSH